MTETKFADCSASCDEEFSPIAVLIQELQNKDVNLRFNAIKKLSTIAVALGEQRTRVELIPFLMEAIYDDKKMLMALAEELSKFVDLIGGPDYAMYLIAPLEGLASVEENEVRLRATDSLCKIALAHSPIDLEIHFVSLLHRLAAAEWFSSRISACSLFVVCYTRVSDTVRAALRVTFRKLSEDKVTAVRYAAARQYGELAKIIELKYLQSDMIPLFVHFSVDEQDSVRFAAIESCVSIIERLPKDCNCSLLFSTLRTCVSDTSWRVRYMLAEKFVDLQLAYGPEKARQDLVPALEYLMRDEKAQVRAAMAGKLKDFIAHVPQPLQVQILVKSVLPHARLLLRDNSPYVRAVMAAAVMGLSPLLGASDTVEHLLPLLIPLFKDDNVEMLANMSRELGTLIEVVGIAQFVGTLLPSIADYAVITKWRVRRIVIGYMPILASTLDHVHFGSAMVELYRLWLDDRIYAIREAAALNVRHVIDEFDADWAKQEMLPMILEFARHKYYLRRITCLQCIASISELGDSELNASLLLPTVLALAVERVANVRFNAAKTLESMLPYLADDVLAEKVRPMLERLLVDGDNDVRNYARQALTLLNSDNLLKEREKAKAAKELKEQQKDEMQRRDELQYKAAESNLLQLCLTQPALNVNTGVNFEEQQQAHNETGLELDLDAVMDVDEYNENEEFRLLAAEQQKSEELQHVDDVISAANANDTEARKIFDLNSVKVVKEEED